VATDHVIESFRNGLWLGYKTGEGIEPDLWAQFPLLEEARGGRRGGLIRPAETSGRAEAGIVLFRACLLVWTGASSIHRRNELNRSGAVFF
jgi:hypothetical protein